MFKPIIIIDKINGSYFYRCQKHRICFDACEHKKECEILTPEFKEFYQRHKYCEYCYSDLERFYVYTLYKIKDYLSKDYRFHCCNCNYDFHYDNLEIEVSDTRISTNRNCRNCKFGYIDHKKIDPNFCKTYYQKSQITIDKIKEKLKEKEKENGI